MTDEDYKEKELREAFAKGLFTDSFPKFLLFLLTVTVIVMYFLYTLGGL